MVSVVVRNPTMNWTAIGSSRSGRKGDLTASAVGGSDLADPAERGLDRINDGGELQCLVVGDPLMRRSHQTCNCRDACGAPMVF